MFKKILFILVTLSLILVACGPATPVAEEPQEPAVAETEAPQEPVADEPQEPEQEPVNLKMMVVDYIPDTTDVWLEEEVVPAFQETHPNVNVEFIYVSWGTLDETVAGYFAAGEGADIINLGSEYISQYGDRLAPLNQYLGEGAWPDIQKFAPGTLDTATWQGELRGLPWLTAPRAYMCNMEKLNEAGYDEIPSTFNGWVSLAQDLTVIEENAVNQAALVTTGRLDDWQEYVSLIYGLGGTLYKEDGAPNFDSPEARTALQFMYDRRRGVYPDETVADLPEAQGNRLSDGSAVCVWSNMWGFPAADDPVWSKIALAAGPIDSEFADAKPISLVFNDWLAVPAYSQNVETAAEFLKFLGSDENLFTYNQGFGSFPPRTDAWRDYVTDSELMTELGALMDNYGVGFADIRESAKFREILQKEMPAYFTDLQDLDTTLENIQEGYTEILEESGLIL